MLAHPRCSDRKKSKSFIFSLNSLYFEVPEVLGRKIKKFKEKRKYNLLRQLIVIYGDRFKTNFGE